MMTPFPSPATGVFGGSFDPIHSGHLILARDVLEQAGLERILFMPASQAPLRSHPPQASAKDRLDLIRAAISGEPAFEVSEVELKAGGTNYTIDTMKSLLSEHPEERFSCIIGADQLSQLPQWRRVEELMELTEFICLERPGFALEIPTELNNLRWRSVQARPIAVSSTEIRDRRRTGLSIRNLLPEPALKIVLERGLYAPDCKPV